MINNDFIRWATGFSGCDGGNPKGNIWLCGFEFGGGNTEEDLVFSDDVTLPAYVGGEYWENRDEFLKFQYNLKAIKLLTALAGKDIGDYESFFRNQSCFDCDSNYFKLNLYPIGFKDTSHQHWADWLVKKTGFTAKQDYLTWCRENRFPILRNWVLTYSPSLILCTGISYAQQFQSAFGSGDENVFTEEVAGKQIKYFLTNNDQTLVAVIYFLGTIYGLKSNDELSLTGKRLAELLHKNVARK